MFYTGEVIAEGKTSTAAPEAWRLSDRDLVAQLAGAEAQVRRLQAQQEALLAEITNRGPMASYGYADLVRMQMDVLHIGRGDACRREARARACHDLTEAGFMSPAPAPQTGEAFAEGAIGEEHVDALVWILAEFPGTLPPEVRAGYEKTLVDLARQADPAAVRKAGRHLLARLDQDGKPPLDNPAQPERELNWHWTRDNRMALKGRLDKETGQRLERLLSPFAKPRPTGDGSRDNRTVGRRNGDAFSELLERAERAVNLGTEAGDAPTVIVTMSLDQLLRCDLTGTVDDAMRPLPAMLNWTNPITAEEARLAACDARIIPAVLGGDGEVLDLGRETRTANRAQRRALALRDKGCVFPGCDRPPAWTQAHHIRWWRRGGPSDIANLCLLCSYHHRLIHHSSWDVRMAADGKPECIPPEWIDPDRRPLRNHVHDPILPRAG